MEPAAEFPVAVATLAQLALETAQAAEEDQVRPIAAEELLGGRAAVRERIRGYADRLFQEVDSLETIDDIEDELVRFARIVQANRGCAKRSTIRRSRSRNGSRLSAISWGQGCCRRRHGSSRMCCRPVTAATSSGPWSGPQGSPPRSGADVSPKCARPSRSTEDEYARLVEALERTAGRPVEVRVQIEPSLLGGMAVEIGDTVIDGSVRHRLDQLREALAPSTGLKDLSSSEHDRSEQDE